MNNTIIFKNEYISIFSIFSDVLVETYKSGFSLKQLDDIFAAHPEIEVVNFTILKSAIDEAPVARQKFAHLKERIVIELINNDLIATIVFNVSKEELEHDNRANLIKELVPKLRSKGILFGIKSELFQEELIGGKTYIIAEGIQVENGTDAIIKMFEIKEVKPEIFEDDKVDYYDMTLITIVEENTWLGERIEATCGKPGKSVQGLMIEPVKGKTFPLLYDKKSVYELVEGNKTVLYSKEYGAVYFLDGKIATMNPLVISGDVGPKTGNIVFDGYIIIKGSICDGFYVEATKDIEIKGELGLGNVKGVVSTGGSIFIKGGILSKGNTEIRAAKDIYTKFADNVNIVSEENTHIGYYCFNSNISAIEVIFDSMKGQIIGGEIKAKTKVVVPILGSELEKRTVVEVAGFDKERIKKDMEEIIARLDSSKKEYQNTKDSIAFLDRQEQPSKYQMKLKYDNIQRLEVIKDEIKKMDNKRRVLQSYLDTRGDGEVRVTKKIFPNCSISIKKKSVEIMEPTFATTFFVSDGKLRET